MEHSKTYVAIPPGRTIQEAIEARPMTPTELASRLGVTEKRVSKLLSGKVELTADVASKLESALGMSARFWLGLEAEYRQDLKRVKAENRKNKKATSLG